MTRFGKWLAEVGRRLRERLCGPVPAMARAVWRVDREGNVYLDARPVVLRAGTSTSLWASAAMVAIETLPPLPPAAEVVVIEHNIGGPVLDFGRTVQEYLNRKSRVRIEGDCGSACTMVAAVPESRLCVGPNARLLFHQAYTPASAVVIRPEDVANRSSEGVAFMSAFYPKRLKRWIASKGGLTANMIVLQGAELRRLFRPCR